MRRLTSLGIIGAFLVASIVTLSQPAGAIVVCGDATLQGCWSMPFSEDGPDADTIGDFDAQTPETVEEAGRFPTAVSIAVTPSGRVVYWDGLTGLEDSSAPLALDAGNSADPDESRLLDLTGSGPAWLNPTPIDGGGPDGMFCADQRLLASGAVVAAGGTDYRTDAAPVLEKTPNPVDPTVGNAELYGSKNTRLYSEPGDDDSAGGTWDYDAARDMANGRWYPSLVTQPDGRLFIAGGVRKLLYNTDAVNVVQTEVYNPLEGGTWSTNGAAGNSSLPLFARLHGLPNGEILYDGVGQMWAPAGEAIDELVWNFHATYNTDSGTWRQMVGNGTFGARSGAFSVPLPLEAPYDEAKFLVGGGTLGVSPSTVLGTQISEIYTAADHDGDASNGWETEATQTSDMNVARWYSSGVLLPNGHVVALNGADKDEVIMPGTEDGIRQTEIWDGDGWNTAASSGRDRTYHNSAILLPDGSVLVGGHAPINRFYGDKGAGDHDTLGPFGNNLRDPSFEIFHPPYLYDSTGAPAARPSVNSGPESAHNGGPLTLAMGEGGPAVDTVVLYRLPSATHTTDADARAIELPPTIIGENVQVTVPDSTAVVPPGYYYVFGLSAAGVPSVAIITKITPAIDTLEASGISTPVHITPIPIRGGVTVPTSKNSSGTPVATSAQAPAATGQAPSRTQTVSLPARERAAQTLPSAGLVALTLFAFAVMGRRGHRLVRART